MNFFLPSFWSGMTAVALLLGNCKGAIDSDSKAASGREESVQMLAREFELKKKCADLGREEVERFEARKMDNVGLLLAGSRWCYSEASNTCYYYGIELLMNLEGRGKVVSADYLGCDLLTGDCGSRHTSGSGEEDKAARRDQDLSFAKCEAFP